MATGYSVFQTVISINAKGNIKVIYQTVSFKTELLEDIFFIKNDGNWNKQCSSTVLEVDSNNIITNQYICFNLNNTRYCMKGGSSSDYANNKAMLDELESEFEECGTNYDSTYYCYNWIDESAGLRVTIGNNGNVSVATSEFQYTCRIWNG